MSLKLTNYKIRHHIMLMFGVLLTLEAALFTGSMWLDNQAENEERKIQRRKDIIAHTSEYVNSIYSVCQIMGAHDSAKNMATWTDSLQNAVSQMDSDYIWLRNAAATADPTLSATLLRVRGRVEETMTSYRELYDAPQAWRLMAKDNPGSPYRKSIDALLAEMANFNDAQIKQQADSSKVEQKLRQQVKNFLVIGISINIMAVMLVAFNLTTAIVLRIDRLIDNVRRMHHKLPLLPQIGGADELSELDEAFHSMASALRKEQDSLRESEQRNRAFIEGAPVGLIALDVNGKIEVCNIPLAKMFGSEPRQLHGRHIAHLFSTGAMSEGDFWEQLKKNATGRLIELAARTREGEEFLAELILAQEGEHGQYMLASVTNIQEKNELTKLRQAVLAMVSHDLRTPLTSISGFLKMLRIGAYGEVAPELNAQAMGAEQSTTRLIELVNDLLDIEKMESGNLKVELAPCDLDTIINQSLNSVAIFAQTKSIKIDVPSATKLEIIADPDRLVQVLVNLIANAVVASPENSHVNLTYSLQSGFLKICVSDPGPGIPLQSQELIFEKFQQIDRPGAKKTKGTGLGLAISKIIVEQHGGEIGVISEVGKGATFWFTIPHAID